MIRIILADDHDMFREALRKVLELEKDFEIIGESGTGRDTLTIVREMKPDLLLLDLDMPDLDGMDVTRQLHEDGVKTKIVILTMHTNEEFAVRLLQAGASGFIPKYKSINTLPEIIRRVMSGKMYIPEEMASDVTFRLLTSSKSDAKALSDRELQIFKAIAEGLTINEIADSLGISPRTVETHKSRLMTKLGLKNVAELVKAAIRMGIINQF